MQKYLSDKNPWISGIRRSQGDARKQGYIIEWDAKNTVVKIYPLVFWTADQVWDEISKQDLPYNPLHNEGYPSIGCISCTAKVANGDSERPGRWKKKEKTECGIHPLVRSLLRTRESNIVLNDAIYGRFQQKIRPRLSVFRKQEELFSRWFLL